MEASLFFTNVFFSQVGERCDDQGKWFTLKNTRIKLSEIRRLSV